VSESRAGSLSLGLSHTWGWIATFSGAVDGWAPMEAGPSGRARCRKESFSAMVAVVMAMGSGVVGVVVRRSGDVKCGWWGTQRYSSRNLGRCVRLHGPSELFPDIHPNATIRSSPHLSHLSLLVEKIVTP